MRRLAALALLLAVAVLAGIVGVVLGLDDVDAHLGQHRHRVLDLLGGHLVGRQGGVQLVIGDVAALLPARHELLQIRAE